MFQVSLDDLKEQVPTLSDKGKLSETTVLIKGEDLFQFKIAQFVFFL